MTAVEVNFDGLVGPTHNYAGLARGNVASAANEGQTSNPRAAALQGLAKMRLLAGLGIPQGVFPPHERPHLPTLRRLGFVGSDADVLQAVMKTSPLLLANASSASAMWTANAATVSPSADTEDSLVHLTPANLTSHFHRAMEAETTVRVLRRVFGDQERFVVHDPVAFPALGDEGAANHCRLSARHGDPGVELFVYGRSAFVRDPAGTAQPRQSYEASYAVASLHRLVRPQGVMLAQQGRQAVLEGAFHNDVVAVSNQNVLMFHEQAFETKDSVLEALKCAGDKLGFSPVLLEASAASLSLREAIVSYLFNSQIVTLPDGDMTLILPQEVAETPRAAAFVEDILSRGGPIRTVHFLDLRQSMRNGGGPACLRLRVVLTGEELKALGASVLLDNDKITQLEDIVRRRYRDRLRLSELADPDLLQESQLALDEISRVIGLPDIHDFQRTGSV